MVEKVIDLGKRHGRIMLVVFTSLVTLFEWVSPAFLDVENAKLVVDGRSEWMILYVMIVTFYFKNKEESGE